jgi:signal transduction histidine kinase
VGDALAAFSRELAAERMMEPDAASAIWKTLEEVRFRDLHIAVHDRSGTRFALGRPESAGEAPTACPLDAADVGRVLASMPADDSRVKPTTTTLASPRGDMRVVVRETTLDGVPLRIVGAYPLGDTDEALARVHATFVVVIPLLVAVAAIGGWLLARRSLAPVQAMGSRAAAISATTLHERLPVENPPRDELGQLATVINRFLDRLEGAFVQQRRFMADASHELRTPAAILRTEAEVTLARDDRTPAEYRESIGAMHDAAQRMGRIVDDLLTLARADAGALAVHRETLHLDDVVHAAVRAARPIAEQQGGALTRRADSTGWDVAVTDSGPGVPADERERIFARFYRADAARSRRAVSATSGTGLGLAIARSIAEGHGGTLTLEESRPGRTTFRLVLPAEGRG